MPLSRHPSPSWLPTFSSTVLHPVRHLLVTDLLRLASAKTWLAITLLLHPARSLPDVIPPANAASVQAVALSWQSVPEASHNNPPSTLPMPSDVAIGQAPYPKSLRWAVIDNSARPPLFDRPVHHAPSTRYPQPGVLHREWPPVVLDAAALATRPELCR